MAKVTIEYLTENMGIIKEEEVVTTGDHVYVLDDIANHMKLDDDFNSIPKGTKEIVIRIPCDM